VGARTSDRRPGVKAPTAITVSKDVVKTQLHRSRALVRDELDARLGGQFKEVFSLQAPRCDRVLAAVMVRIGVE
jgi:RNA polymerase sigma-70 factor (ECF subfamily)